MQPRKKHPCPHVRKSQAGHVVQLSWLPVQGLQGRFGCKEAESKAIGCVCSRFTVVSSCAKSGLRFSQVRTPVVRRRRSRSTLARRLCCGSRLCSFAIRLLQVTICSLLRTSRVVIGLFGFTIFIHCAFALSEQIKNHPKVEMPPDL